MLGSQNTLATTAPPSLAHHFSEPLAESEPPVSSNQHTRKHVNELHDKGQESVAVLIHRQQDRFNVVLNEDTGDTILGNGHTLFGDGILVGKDGAGADAVSGWHDGNVVLHLVEMVRGNVDGAVERVDERRVVRAKGQFGDDV